MSNSTPSEAPRLFDVFVYGSLRAGLHNADMLRGAVKAGPFTARVHGMDLYSNHSATFPYLARGTGIVTGELLTVEWGKQLQRVVGMEEGAGYDSVVGKIEVRQTDGAWLEQDALIFVHSEARRHARGPLVEGGDWVAYLNELDERAARHHMFTEVRPSQRVRPLLAPAD